MKEFYFKTANGVQFVATANTKDEGIQNLINDGWKVSKENLTLTHSKKI